MLNKQRLFPLILVLLLIIVWRIRDNEGTKWIDLSGQTMGTTYTVKYEDSEARNFKPEIDSILVDFNNSVSTYIRDSEISRFNGDSIFQFESSYFYPILRKSEEVYSLTQGAFDPTVMPLVNIWGFGPEQFEFPDSTSIDSLMNYVGFDLVIFDKKSVRKKKKNVQLDFSAIAKGHGVDIVGEFLINQGVKNLFVEIGGEVIAMGVNQKGGYWRIGIEDPSFDLLQRELQAVIEISNQGMATSGNYRNFYIKNGKKYAHTINPKTGYGAEGSVLSATVLADDCATADALATAFMVMGFDKSVKFLTENPNIQGYLIYSTDEGELKSYSSDGIRRLEEVK